MMREWTLAFYKRIRPFMPEGLQQSLDDARDHGGWTLLFGDGIGFAAKNGLLTDDDKRTALDFIDRGLFRKAKPYFEELLKD